MFNADLLFKPYQLTPQIQLQNRIIMAPMTRNMANNDGTPTLEMIDYYARRSEAGLIITEGAAISSDAIGYNNVPGIFNEMQIAAWKRIVEEVHQRRGLIFLQLWHVGRVRHPDCLQQDKLPISASNNLLTDNIVEANKPMFGKYRAATLMDIKELILNYAIAAKNAIAAGFDGVEIHGANGYLIDQFLHYGSNHRNDCYGGSPENMVRLTMEIVEACAETVGFHSMGIRLSPGAYMNGIIGDKRDALVFKNLLLKLNKCGIAYVHTGNNDDKIKFKILENKTMTQFIRSYYNGTVIACGSYTFDDAIKSISNNEFNLIAFGRDFIANPDLVSRLKTNRSITQYDRNMLNTLL